MGPWGPLREEGVSHLGLGAKGGAHHPPWPAHCPPLGSLVPHGGGEEDGTPPLAYIRRGRPPFFQHTNISFFLLLLPGIGLPLFGVCTWIGVLHNKEGRRSAVVGIRSRLSDRKSTRLN